MSKVPNKISHPHEHWLRGAFLAVMAVLFSDPVDIQRSIIEKRVDDNIHLTTKVDHTVLATREATIKALSTDSTES